MSQAFASVQTSGSAPSRVAGETSVPVVCTMLEDAGMTICRCNGVEEAISKARYVVSAIIVFSGLIFFALCCAEICK